MRTRVKYVLYNGVLYHPNFFKRAAYCLKRAKYTCQHCGIKRGEEYITKEGNTDKAVIQAAHVNHDPTKARAKLIALCKPCHLRYDGPMHGEKAGRTKRRKKIQKQLDAGIFDLTFTNSRKSGMRPVRTQHCQGVSTWSHSRLCRAATVHLSYHDTTQQSATVRGVQETVPRFD